MPWVRGDPSTEIQGLAYHTRDVAGGTLFFCVPGLKVDGHRFAAEAVAGGAAALVLSTTPARPRPGDRAFGAPRHGAHGGALVRSSFTRAARRGHHRHQREDHHGAPGGGILRRRRRAGGAARHGGQSHRWSRPRREAHHGGSARPAAHVSRDGDGGDLACALEISSHALALERAAGIEFDAVVFSNLTRDHLDFHADLDDYFSAKRRLFLPAETRNGAARAIVNVGDEFGLRLAGDCRRRTATTSGPTPLPVRQSAAGRGAAADALAHDLELRAGSSAFTLSVPRLGVEQRVGLRLAARFNVENALAAATTALRWGCRWPPWWTDRRSPRGYQAALKPCARGNLRRDRRLLSHPGFAGERLARGARRDRRSRARGVRLRRRSRSRQAPADGRDRGASGRSRRGDLRQPARRGAPGDHRARFSAGCRPRWPVR